MSYDAIHGCREEIIFIQSIRKTMSFKARKVLVHSNFDQQYLYAKWLADALRGLRGVDFITSHKRTNVKRLQTFFLSKEGPTRAYKQSIRTEKPGLGSNSDMGAELTSVRVTKMLCCSSFY